MACAIVDDPVVHHGDAAARVGMGMGVDLRSGRHGWPTGCGRSRWCPRSPPAWWSAAR